MIKIFPSGAGNKLENAFCISPKGLEMFEYMRGVFLKLYKIIKNATKWVKINTNILLRFKFKFFNSFCVAKFLK